MKSSFLQSAFVATSTLRSSNLLSQRQSLSLSSSLKMSSSVNVYPELLVYDMDACLWDQEMYEMREMPSNSNVVQGDLNGRGEGVTGVMSGYNKISLHKCSLVSLQVRYNYTYTSLIFRH